MKIWGSLLISPTVFSLLRLTLAEQHVHKIIFLSGFPCFLELSVEFTSLQKVLLLKDPDSACYNPQQPPTPRQQIGVRGTPRTGLLSPGGSLSVCYYLLHNSGLRY